MSFSVASGKGRGLPGTVLSVPLCPGMGSQWLLSDPSRNCQDSSCHQVLHQETAGRDHRMIQTLNWVQRQDLTLEIQLNVMKCGPDAINKRKK